MAHRLTMLGSSWTGTPCYPRSVTHTVQRYLPSTWATIPGTAYLRAGSDRAEYRVERRLADSGNWRSRLDVRGGWGSQWGSFVALENSEAGWNLAARNPSSGAYGLAQFIDGPYEYFQYGGDPNTCARTNLRRW